MMMAALAEQTMQASEVATLRRVTDLLGGDRVFRRSPDSALDAHAMLLEGLPGSALHHLLDNLQVMGRTASLEDAVGMSLRTFQRRKDLPMKRLNREQSGRTWKFAEILGKATELLGTQEAAELWLESPAIGLDRHRPIDLLATPAGVELVENYLDQLRYGVYV